MRAFCIEFEVQPVAVEPASTRYKPGSTERRLLKLKKTLKKKFADM